MNSQITQLQENLRQIRQNINSMVTQVNQQLMISEDLLRAMGRQMPGNQMAGQMTGQTATTPQYGTGRYSGQQSAYNQYQGTSQNYGNNINPISGLSENRSTQSRQRGVNNYGARYSTGQDYGR